MQFSGARAEELCLDQGPKQLSSAMWGSVRYLFALFRGFKGEKKKKTEGQTL